MRTNVETRHVESQRHITRAKKFQAEVKQYIQDSLCVHCFGEAALLHHVNPTTKRFNVSAAGTRSFDTILDEIEKCVPLCVNCHNQYHKPWAWAEIQQKAKQWNEIIEAVETIMTGGVKQIKGKSWTVYDTESCIRIDLFKES